MPAEQITLLCSCPINDRHLLTVEAEFGMKGAVAAKWHIGFTQRRLVAQWRITHFLLKLVGRCVALRVGKTGMAQWQLVRYEE